MHARILWVPGEKQTKKKPHRSPRGLGPRATVGQDQKKVRQALALKWINEAQASETREVAITGEQFTHAMLKAQSHDVGIVNQVARDSGLLDDVL